MKTQSGSIEKKWYVLNYVSRSGKSVLEKYIDSFNRSGHSVELFAPIIREGKIVNGKVVYHEKFLTFYYIFVKGSFDEVKTLCLRTDNNLSFLLDKDTVGRYAVIGENAMKSFKLIARAHANAIPFFNIEDVDLQDGDLIEVVDGNYAGVTGTFIPHPRSKKGDIVIRATSGLGAVVRGIEAKHVRILEFAKGTRRQYDLVDSFIPKLYPVLRKYHAEIPLDEKEKNLLNIFNCRMGVVVPQNHKAEAKLLATLMCVQFILGDIETFNTTIKRFNKRKNILTNVWTLALVELMMSVINHDMNCIKNAYESVIGLTDKPTESQSLLLEEFKHYINQ